MAQEKSESRPHKIKPAIVTTPITIKDVEVVSERVGQITRLISFLDSKIILRALAPSAVLKIKIKANTKINIMAKTQTKKMISPEDQMTRDPDTNPIKASSGSDPITDAKLEILSTVASSPVFFTPATAIPEAIQNLYSWEDSDLQGELYSRNFKNVILSRISGTPAKLETYEETNKKT